VLFDIYGAVEVINTYDNIQELSLEKAVTTRVVNVRAA
jgi:hypothetical protein